MYSARLGWAMSAPDGHAELEEIEKYRFTVTFEGAPFPSLTVDEAPPTGGDAGPNPVQDLVMAVGHCMSSTFLYSLERARVPVAPIRTSVRATIGLNDRGRRRVRKLDVTISTYPLHDEDRSRFDRAVETFADFCTVSGAVREGVEIAHRVVPPNGPAPP